ncbi:MAG: TM2 domain-containing protein [Aureispira sp.]|nr:TM2 domain-containing protein [Aureispira sp.]
MKNRYVAILLAFFFGWLGAHKFYLEKPFQGILHFMTPPFGWLIAVIEAVKMVQMSDDEFDYEYNLRSPQKMVSIERQKLAKQRLLNERKSLERQQILEDKRFKKELKKLKNKKEPKRIPLTGEMADQLAAWHDLKQQGIINEFEYEEKRKEILGNGDY